MQNRENPRLKNQEPEGPGAGFSAAPAASLSSGTIRPGLLHRPNTPETQLPTRLALDLVDVRERRGSVDQFWIDAASSFKGGVIPAGLRENVERHANRIQQLALRFNNLADQHQDSK